MKENVISWREGIHWIGHTFRGEQQMLSDRADYQFYAERMGYKHLELTKIPALRVYLSPGMDTLAAWMKAHPECVPKSWHLQGFTEPDEICCYASIHNEEIKTWCE